MTTATSKGADYASVQFKPLGKGRWQAKRGDTTFMVFPQGFTMRGRPLYAAEIHHRGRRIAKLEMFRNLDLAKGWLQHWDQRLLAAAVRRAA